MQGLEQSETASRRFMKRTGLGAVTMVTVDWSQKWVGSRRTKGGK